MTANPFADRPPTDRALAALDLFVGVTATIGGLGLIIRPRGAFGLPLSMLDHAPFADFLVPGLILLVVVGGSALVAFAAFAAGRRSFVRLSGVAGGILLAWLVVQLALIRSVSVLHFVYAGVAIAQFAMARTALNRPGRERLVGEIAAAARSFFSDGPIAFVGLSTDEKSFSRAVARELDRGGVAFVPIHPAAREIDGRVAFPRLAAVTPSPRSVLIMTPRHLAEAVVADCIDAGAHRVWFHRGSGEGSATPEAVARARAAGMTVISDVCPLMFLEPVQWFHRAHRNARFGARARQLVHHRAVDPI